MADSSIRVFVGVLRMCLVIDGARNLKDRRRVVRSLQDRIRHKFSVSIHQLGGSSRPTEQEIVVTTAGNNRVLIRKTLQDVATFVEQGPAAWVREIDMDVFRWQATLDSFEDHSRFTGGFGGGQNE
jgi:uncharacterized protein YlxP (DUF503 family)